MSPSPTVDWDCDREGCFSPNPCHNLALVCVWGGGPVPNGNWLQSFFFWEFQELLLVRFGMGSRPSFS